MTGHDHTCSGPDVLKGVVLNDARAEQRTTAYWAVEPYAACPLRSIRRQQVLVVLILEFHLRLGTDTDMRRGRLLGKGHGGIQETANCLLTEFDNSDSPKPPDARPRITGTHGVAAQL